jgi:hypothetical protein
MRVEVVAPFGHLAVELGDAIDDWHGVHSGWLVRYRAVA